MNQKWMKEDLREVVEEVLSEDSIGRRGIFSVEGVREKYRAFLRGECGYPVVWQFVMLELWMRRTFDHSPAISCSPGR